MPDDDQEYFTVTEAKRRAGMRSNKTIAAAVQSGRLKTVTKMSGPRIVHLTTQAWLDAYLASRSTRQRPNPMRDDDTPA